MYEHGRTMDEPWTNHGRTMDEVDQSQKKLDVQSDKTNLDCQENF